MSPNEANRFLSEHGEMLLTEKMKDWTVEQLRFEANRRFIAGLDILTGHKQVKP